MVKNIFLRFVNISGINSNNIFKSSLFLAEGMFGRTLQSYAQQNQAGGKPPNKEPNLMPVPSPQQIQYLNTFEGQELTIQKQPNISLRENDIMSPAA